jgi:hypothetical protein
MLEGSEARPIAVPGAMVDGGTGAKTTWRLSLPAVAPEEISSSEFGSPGSEFWDRELRLVQGPEPGNPGGFNLRFSSAALIPYGDV